MASDQTYDATNMARAVRRTPKDADGIPEDERRKKGQDKILVRGPSEVLDAFDAYADELDVARAEALRLLLVAAGRLKP